MEIVRRVNIVLAACGTAALCSLAGSQLAVWMTDNQRTTTAVDRTVGSSMELPVTDQSDFSVDDQSVDRQEPSMDLYGNEVTSAVATYKLDPSGTVYEEHSPQTEVPRLAAPTS